MISRRWFPIIRVAVVMGGAVPQALAGGAAAVRLRRGAGEEDSAPAMGRAWAQIHRSIEECDATCGATQVALNEAISARDAIVRSARGVKASIRRRRQGKLDAANAGVDSAKEAWVDAVVARCLVDAEIQHLRDAGVEEALEALAEERHAIEIAEAEERLTERAGGLLEELGEVTRLSRNYRVLASRIDAEAFDTKDAVKVRALRDDQHKAGFRARLCLHRRNTVVCELRGLVSEIQVVAGYTASSEFASELDASEAEEREFSESYEDFSRDLRLRVDQQVAYIEWHMRTSRGKHSRFGSRARTHRANRRAQATVTHGERGLTFVA